jgi:S-DNA-T family DNA segregation ATPase FtsK/SpoIIIE
MSRKIVKRKEYSYSGNKSASSFSEEANSALKKSLDGVVYLSTHYGRFARDVLGITFIFSSILTFLALLGLTGGVVLRPWSDFLLHWFGWGALLINISVGFIGYFVLKRKGDFWSLYFWKIVYFEMLVVSLLSLFAVLTDYDLGLAEAGIGGGLVGWALAQMTAEIVGRTVAGVVWFIIPALMIFYAAAVIRQKRRSSRGEGLNGPVLNGESGSIKRLTVQKRREETEGKQPHLPIQAGRHQKIDNTKNDYRYSSVRAEENKQNLGSRQLKNLAKDPLKTMEKNNTAPISAGKSINRESSLPPLSLLMEDQVVRLDETTINQTASILEKTLMDFGIPAKVIGYRMGPTVTQFAVEPGYTEKPAPEGQTLKQKVRVSQISQLSKDLALALSSTSIRIEAPVPGKSYVGIEIPNVRSVVVRMKSLLESDKFNKLNSPLAVALGRDVSGQPVVGDLSRMPHLLIAGTTGSGKSVCITALAASLAMNNSPEDLRLVMIDPKMVELVRFNGLPHMFGKVETELERILGVLRWVTQEMDRRYIAFSGIGARDLDAYNKKMEKRGEEVLPRIVVFIDELADLMMSAQASTEPLLVRLAQLARATGIHMIVATQRPSSTVVTGLIKANFPARISFAVSSHVDSRVILDSTGAENLLGRGDMLFLDPEKAVPVRTQGVMVSDAELEGIISHWQKEQPDSINNNAPWENMLFEEQENGGDDLIQQAIEVVKQSRRASASLIQRKLRIGYPRAARIIEELEEMGIVGPGQGGGKEREVLIDLDEDANNFLED